MVKNEPSISSDTEAPPVTPPGHDIFTDPALTQTLKEDPLFRFLEANWRQVLLAVGFVLAAVYAKQVFHETRVAEMERAADIFSRARTEYDQFVALTGQLDGAKKRLAEKADKGEKTDPAKKEGDPAVARVTELEKEVAESRRRLDGHLGSLADARSPYREFGGLYKGLLARAAAGEGGAVKEMRAALGAPAGAIELGDAPDLPNELRAMALARTLIDSPADRAQGWGSLKDLAVKAQYVNISAALALAHIANTPAEREEALKTIEAVLVAHPEQESLLSPEISRLKGAKS